MQTPLTVYSNTLGVFLIGYKLVESDDLAVGGTATNLIASRAVTVLLRRWLIR